MNDPSHQMMDKQLRRQAMWLRESWLWLLETKVIGKDAPEGRLSALDVGCGPGFVMDELKGMLAVKGVDVDVDMVTACNARGLDVVEASVYDLPYDDGAFDIVYSTFLLMWLDKPVQALDEMARVSKGHVLSLAEPDFGARIDHPPELADVRDIVVKGFRSYGADPHMGRKLREVYRWAGIPAEIGVHAGVWDSEQLRTEFPDEWDYVERAAHWRNPIRLARIRESWEKALEMGTMFSYNPVFYALGRKRE